jgi:hypothetical protein
MTKQTLEKTLSDFALELATKARLRDTPLDQATDTFKALTAYRALELKGRKGQEDTEDDHEPTMSDLQRQINGGG